VGLVTPFVLIGVIIILVLRFGWPGIIAPIVTLIFIPIQLLVGKINGTILPKVNAYKDQRIKICT